MRRSTWERSASSGVWDTSSRMSISEQGCSSPRPYPPTATSAPCRSALPRCSNQALAQDRIDEGRPGVDQDLHRFLGQEAGLQFLMGQAQEPAVLRAGAGMGRQEGRQPGEKRPGRLVGHLGQQFLQRFAQCRSAAPKVRMSTPVSVTRQVCSHWADRGMVLGDHGPAIGQQAHVTLTRIDHRFHCKGHPLLKLGRSLAPHSAGSADLRGKCGRCHVRNTRAPPRNSRIRRTPGWHDRCRRGGCRV